VRLGTQVTIRLEPDAAERLREVASCTRLGYTTMLRQWVQQRLLRETCPAAPPAPVIQTAGVAGWPQVQMTGAGRLT
jgi:hypothetical protein